MNHDDITILRPGEPYPPTLAVAKQPRPLPAVQTFTANNLHGSRQIWSAITMDGLWSIERLERPGTPWSLLHLPTGTAVAELGSLRACLLQINAIRDARQLEECVCGDLGIQHSEFGLVPGCQVEGCGCIEFRLAS